MTLKTWMIAGLTVSLVTACSGDEGDGATDDVGVAEDDVGQMEVAEPDVGNPPVDEPDATDATDVPEDRVDMSDPPVPPQTATALVVESDPDAETSAYGVVELTTEQGVVPTVWRGEPIEFGDGHVHVNAGDRGVYVMDSRNGVVRVLEIDTAVETNDYRHVVDVDLQTGADPEFATQPQWVGEHEGTSSLVISQFGKGAIAKVPIDWEAGEAGPIVNVDLSSFDDEDGNPEPTVVLVDGEYALVALQRLGPGYSPTKNGSVLVWHIPTESVSEVVELAGMHFHAGMKWGPGGHIYAGLSGEVGTPSDPILDGGILRIEREDAGRYSSDPAFLVTEADLGGELWGFALQTESQGYAVVRTATGRQLVAFDVGDDGTTFTVVSGVATPSGWVELVSDPAQLWIADLGGESPATAGMRVLDLEGAEVLNGHDKLGFEGRPTSFAVTERHAD